MITEIRYQNFRALKAATLKLAPFTLIVGPNGSGKSTAIKALPTLQSAPNFSFENLASVDARLDPQATVMLEATFANGQKIQRSWVRDQQKQQISLRAWQMATTKPLRSRVFSLDPAAIAAQTQIKPAPLLAENGGELAAVLENLRDQHPERFDELAAELRRWLPDFDNLLFQTPQPGFKSISLRTQVGRHPIAATELSHGTLFALALLTIAYLPSPPEIIAIEEPDRGIHPRLLREVRDALYRLAYPGNMGVDRKPVQVIATTHSPYLVDLFSDHPEEVVLAQKEGLHATLTRLTDQPNWEEILRDAQLGDLWYSGVLGGVPAGS